MNKQNDNIIKDSQQYEARKKIDSLFDGDENVEWGGWLNEILWICAGVNRRVLRQCPTDYAKYAGIGGTILFTALMAMLSGGYALSTVFHNQWLSIGFGIFWGMLIFNLDRFIVNTMYSDGKPTISFTELISGFPRIVMAIFLGIVISMPLELKIFEDEIDVKIQEMRQMRLNDYQSGDNNQIISLQHRRDSLNTVRTEVFNSPVVIAVPEMTSNVQLNNYISECRTSELNLKHFKEQRSSLYYERNKCLQRMTKQDTIKANDLTNRIWQLNREIKSLEIKVAEIQSKMLLLDQNIEELHKQAVQKKDLEVSRFDTEIASIDKEIDNLKEKMSNDGFKELLDNEFRGFQAKMSAFSQMKKENDSTNLASLFILLLFVIIETAPTFFKMMMSSGPYDDRLRSEMHRVRVLSDKQISDLNDEINTDIRISVEKNKDRYEAEIQANKDIMEIIATAQANLLQTAIEKWREQELAKIEEDPSLYVKND